jgi:hypothetical protein
MVLTSKKYCQKEDAGRKLVAAMSPFQMKNVSLASPSHYEPYLTYILRFSVSFIAWQLML